MTLVLLLGFLDVGNKIIKIVDFTLPMGTVGEPLIQHARGRCALGCNPGSGFYRL